MKNENIYISKKEMDLQNDTIEKIRILNQGKHLKYICNTFGCQMNESDSEKLAGMLCEMGFYETDDVSESDLIIFNTCCVRENAEQKVYGHLGALKKLKKNNPKLIIAVCGCMMQQTEVVEHIKQKYKHVDVIFGTHNLHKFPELLYNLIISQKTVIDVWESTGMIAEGIPVHRKDDIKAWITVMYGCNNYCSYCIVPYVRGSERSRNIQDIINEANLLSQKGYKEITLLGQNVNSYGNDLDNDTSFSQLLSKVNGIEGIERIRFISSHPKDLKADIINAVKKHKKICEHIHLPIQSGSTRILGKMNRKYTKEQYLDLIRIIRNEIPDCSITTDIIVGFPGETEEDFEDTLDVVRKARFDTSYTFLYSMRKGTPAAKNKQQVPELIKKQRFDRLLSLQNRISREINDGLMGKQVEILVEGPSKNNFKNYTGRTRTNKVVNFEANENMVGKLVNVKIQKTRTWSLEGMVCTT